MEKHDESRRRFAKKLAYIAPAILTLKARPSFAAAGSGRGGYRGGRQDNHSNHYERSPRRGGRWGRN